MINSIRTHTPEDLSNILDIWSDANKLAHPFLSPEFVKMVSKAMETQFIPGSDTWVYTEGDQIIGFISMAGNEIGGLFVFPEHSRKGIGRALVEKVDQMHETLEVEVFEKNHVARPFYEREGFSFLKKYLHEPSGEVVIRLQRRRS